MRTPTKDELCGVWLLEAIRLKRKDGKTEHPFGRKPSGTIIYLRNGSMAVHIRGSDEADRKLCAYGGIWSIAGDCVVHDVEVSFEPELRGVRLERRARFDLATGTLIYTTVEAQGAGHPVVTWRKKG